MICNVAAAFFFLNASTPNRMICDVENRWEGGNLFPFVAQAAATSARVPRMCKKEVVQFLSSYRPR